MSRILQCFIFYVFFSWTWIILQPPFTSHSHLLSILLTNALIIWISSPGVLHIPTIFWFFVCHKRNQASRMEQMARNLFANHLIPSLLIFLLVQFHPSTQFSNFTDYSALMAFKSRIRSDPNGILSSNWSSSKSFCNWVGVSCTPSNDSIWRVTSSQLQGMGLQGTLAPQIANLSFLVVLDLSDNHFNSTVCHVPQNKN